MRQGLRYYVSLRVIALSDRVCGIMLVLGLSPGQTGSAASYLFTLGWSDRV